MSSDSSRRATIRDLHRVEGKAELIGGKIVHYRSAGDLPSCIAAEIALALREYARTTGRGKAYPSGVGYVIPELPSGRESFQADASYYTGPLPTNPRSFIEGPPSFAVEVRDEDDYGDAAESVQAAKRTDYLQAGTLVVWDVDTLAETVTVYRGDPQTPAAVFRRGDVADAEPAVPGWRMTVDDMFTV
jgi:Uma2 family endonuclease